jgi:hypothetical protein
MEIFFRERKENYIEKPEIGSDNQLDKGTPKKSYLIFF